MAYKDKIRVIRLQEQLSVARKALVAISHGQRYPETTAYRALEKIQEGDFKEGGNPDAIENIT